MRSLILAVGILILLLGLVLVGLEGYLWTQLDHWPSFSLLDGIRLFMVFAVSDVGIYNFERWLSGWAMVGKVLDALPLGLSVSGLGAILIACVARRRI